MRHVVLDTEVFRHENLAFDSPRFERLTELVDEGEIEVHVTDVVVEEVKRGVAEQVRMALQLLRQEPTRRALNVLARGDVPKLKELLKDIDEEEIVNGLINDFDQLLDDLEANILVTDDVPMKEIRERYFNVTPPFGYRADKKHEFPDAISIIAIEAWSRKQTQAVVVVSADSGVGAAAKAIKGVQHVSELRQVIDFVLRRLEIVEDPDALLNAKKREIEQRVRGDFERLGFYVEGAWGEVVDVTVESVKLGSAYLAERKGDVVTLDFDVEVRYSAELSFDDPDQTAYDSETRDTYVFGSISQTVTDTAWLEGQVDITLSVADVNKSKVESVFLPISDIGVSPPPEPDYK